MEELLRWRSRSRGAGELWLLGMVEKTASQSDGLGGVGVEAELFAHRQPQLADQHRPYLSLLQGEPSQDIDQALLGQIGPVQDILSHCFFTVRCLHFDGCVKAREFGGWWSWATRKLAWEARALQRQVCGAYGRGYC
ncbi:hypothetical protein FF1_015163 [Malus domestica]